MVPGGITLKRLHDSLQAVMGWADNHLHQFEMDGVLYGTSDRESGMRRVSENKTTVDQLLRRPKGRLTYEYDFGDSWEHDVILEAVLPQGGDGRYPIFIVDDDTTGQRILMNFEKMKRWKKTKHGVPSMRVFEDTAEIAAMIEHDHSAECAKYYEDGSLK